MIYIRLLFVLQKKSNAQSTFDQVLRRLSIKEKDFFAFEFEDEQKNSVSLCVSLRSQL